MNTQARHVGQLLPDLVAIPARQATEQAECSWTLSLRDSPMPFHCPRCNGPIVNRISGPKSGVGKASLPDSDPGRLA